MKAGAVCEGCSLIICTLKTIYYSSLFIALCISLSACEAILIIAMTAIPRKPPTIKPIKKPNMISPSFALYLILSLLFEC